MTKVIGSEKEKEIINILSDNIIKTFIGTDEKTIDRLKRLTDKYIKSIEIIPYGVYNEYISSYMPGICLNNADHTSKIVVYGFKNRGREYDKKIVHEFTHELIHAYNNFFPALLSENPNGKDVISSDGEIFEEYSFTGELAFFNKNNYNESYFYGKMFTETLTDLLTTISIKAYSKGFLPGDDNVDKVLKNHINTSGDYISAYGIFTSLTRLMIAAFSNNGNVSYQNLVDNGIGIITAETTTSLNKKLNLNDFIFGMTCDPMYLEKQYDLIMGPGKFIELSAKLDQIFDEYLNTSVINNKMISVIKDFMFELSHFLNKRKDYYINNGIMTYTEFNRIISNYNSIWNDLQIEYKSYFTNEDINYIYQKASEPFVKKIGRPDIPPKLNK